LGGPGGGAGAVSAARAGGLADDDEATGGGPAAGSLTAGGPSSSRRLDVVLEALWEGGGVGLVEPSPPATGCGPLPATAAGAFEAPEGLDGRDDRDGTPAACSRPTGIGASDPLGRRAGSDAGTVVEDA